MVDPRHDEPFVKLLPQGMVTGQSFKIKATGQYISPKDAVLDDDQKMVRTYGHRSCVAGDGFGHSLEQEKLLISSSLTLLEILIVQDLPPSRHMRTSRSSI